MLDKLSDNLNLLMARTRINANELARQTGVPASTIKKIRSCHNVNPTLATLIPIAQKFSVSVSQLIGDIDTIEINHTEHSSNNESYLPLLSWQAAINWPNVNNIHFISSNIESKDYNSQSFALTITEDHWQGFSKDSVIIIDTQSDIKHTDFALVHKSGQPTPSLRQVLFDDDHIYLKPVINDFQISQMTSNARFIGVVVEIRKKLKK